LRILCSHLLRTLFRRFHIRSRLISLVINALLRFRLLIRSCRRGRLIALRCYLVRPGCRGCALRRLSGLILLPSDSSVG
jgi:hypothetical protein